VVTRDSPLLSANPYQGRMRQVRRVLPLGSQRVHNPYDGEPGHLRKLVASAASPLVTELPTLPRFLDEEQANWGRPANRENDPVEGITNPCSPRSGVLQITLICASV
jgi:hypothetical protein